MKNAYFNGRQLEGAVFFERPQGGFPQLEPAQVVRAKNVESLVREGWRRSLLEDAFFTLRRDGQLVAMSVTHVLANDDSLGGPGCADGNSGLEVGHDTESLPIKRIILGRVAFGHEIAGPRLHSRIASAHDGRCRVCPERTLPWLSVCLTLPCSNHF